MRKHCCLASVNHTGLDGVALEVEIGAEAAMGGDATNIFASIVSAERSAPHSHSTKYPPFFIFMNSLMSFSFSNASY